MPAHVATVKPLMRGVSHQFACCVALIAGLFLIAIASTPAARLASSIYAASMVLLYGASALYHRGQWQPRIRLWLQRVDHSSIFVLIAGTYTPICLLALRGGTGEHLLTWVWTGAALGILQACLWPSAPRAVIVLFYLVLGWLIIPYLGEAAMGLGPRGFALLTAGGISYSVGALVYAFRRPDPVPAVFGYHEVFHLFVIAASVCHFAAIYPLVQASVLS